MKEGLLSKKEPLKIWKILSQFTLPKSKKVFLEGNTRHVARPSLDKEIMGRTHEFDASLGRSQEYRWGLYQQKHY